MRRLRELTGPLRATARKIAISTQLIGLRSRKTSQSAMAKATMMNNRRTITRAVSVGMTLTVGGTSRLGGSSGTPTEAGIQARLMESCLLHGAEELRAQPRDAEHAGAGVGADHGADLRQQLGVAAVELAA